MALFSILTRLGAAGALAFATLTPVALADRGDRGNRGHYDRGEHRGDRGDRHRGNRGHYQRDNRRHHRYNRGRHHNNWNRGRHYNRRYNRGYNRSYNNYYRPRVVTRNYYSAPSYGYRSRPSVNYYYNRGYSHSGYVIGNRYNYNPNTIVISDYSRYGLYSPPAGHRWVRDRNSGDAILASVATGAIVGLAIGILSN